MSKSKSSGKKTSKHELPGLPLDRFRMGVQSVVELRDQGKYLIFFSRRKSVQLIGDTAEYQETFSAKLDEQRSEDSNKVLAEILQILSARIRIGSNERVVTLLLRHHYDDDLEKCTDEQKSLFEEQLKEKVSIVENELFTESLRERSARFESLTLASLEDFDFEVIKERNFTSKSDVFDEPFLRLRIRYSKGTEQNLGNAVFGFIGQNPFDMTELHSFEMECDESDIDLLMLRLTAAKQRLIKAREINSVDEDD